MVIFSGTSYLGLDRHPQMIEWINKGLSIYGTHYGGSRRSNLAPEIYTQTEEKLAKWIGAPAALLLSSGSTAGQLVSRYLTQKDLINYYSPNAHPTLWGLNMQQSIQWNEWFGQLIFDKTVGLTDSIDPLKISIPNWELLPSKTTSCLVVDDAHYIGIGGENGTGSWKQLRQKWPGKLIVTASLGKALATPAGLILSDKKTIEDIKSLPQFGGASPPPPAYIFALNQASKLIKQQQLNLQKNIHIVQKTLKNKANFSFIKGYPVISVSDHSLADKLLKEGILISSFRYPSPEDPIYTRIVLRADHTEEQLKKLISVIK